MFHAAYNMKCNRSKTYDHNSTRNVSNPKEVKKKGATKNKWDKCNVRF